MREFPDSAAFTLDQAAAADWSRSAVRNAVAHDRLRRVRPGVYSPHPAPDPVVDAIAAALAYPDVVVSHRSALLLHNLPLVGVPPRVAEVTVPPKAAGNRTNVNLHRAGVRETDLVMVGSTPVTSVARTLCDVARHRPTTAAVAAIDAALHRDVVTVEELSDVLRFCSHWPRIRRAKRAVSLADGRAESPLESVSRLVIDWLGLPEPEPQKWIHDEFGNVVGRVDFYWDEFGVVGEADGRMKYRGREDAFPKEKERQEALEDLSLFFVRWGWVDLTHYRQLLRHRILRGFERGRRRDRSGSPRLWSL